MDLNDIDDGSERVEGTFQCHRCEEFVNEARLNHNQNTLEYVCQQGHRSKLKEFF